MLNDRRNLLLLLCFFGFVAVGLPDGLTGVAWPSIRADFGEPIDALGYLLIAATAGYVASSVATGVLLGRLGIGGLLAVSSAVCGLALAGYAWAPAWAVMLGFAVTVGLGAGAIDAAINTYAAVNCSARVVNLLHAFYGVGTAAGPIVLTTVFASGGSWRTGYLCVAAAEVAFAVCFASTRRSWPAPVADKAAERVVALKDTLAMRTTQLSMLVFVVYCGLEAAAGAWVYSLLSGSRGVDVVAAGTAVTAYWLALFAGRVVYALVPARSTADNVITVCICGAMAGAGLLTADIGTVADTVAIAFIGFCSGPIFPSLIAATPARLGESHTANAVGLQIGISALGLVGLPTLLGVFAGRAGLEVVPTSLLAGWVLLLVAFVALRRTPAPFGQRVASKPVSLERRA